MVFMLLGGRPAGGPEFYPDGGVRTFSAHLFSLCFISRNVSARPGGGGPQFFHLIFVLGVDPRYLRPIREAGD